ncbi:PHD FINGER PROTEIN MALE MEIOCYTE DEATH 1-RELATED [Salix koriyanagi]|uniref:PHD FINGER PROTEIN MALE MEIOCYTE DEATH 1-RELATED n=1 Tax=Salix koriyanagi TaxID=2511006 RepID=A0A9Q0ZLD9_9ROSI|nr:PHD FINGER PROTEIN MALE MEIOCYTE DEATH 1-RELATED [Salix koriyanagi]
MMSYLDLISSRKRKREERVFRFKIFGENGYPAEFDGSFEQNIRKLLELAHFDRNNCSRMPSWSFKLEVIRQPTLHITLFVVEEPIEASLEHHCKHCQYVGEVLIP